MVLSGRKCRKQVMNWRWARCVTGMCWSTGRNLNRGDGRELQLVGQRVQCVG